MIARAVAVAVAVVGPVGAFAPVGAARAQPVPATGRLTDAGVIDLAFDARGAGALLFRGLRRDDAGSLRPFVRSRSGRPARAGSPARSWRTGMPRRR